MTTILVTKDKLDLIFQFMLLSFWKQTDTTLSKKKSLWLGHNDEPWSGQMFPGNAYSDESYFEYPGGRRIRVTEHVYTRNYNGVEGNVPSVGGGFTKFLFHIFSCLIVVFLMQQVYLPNCSILTYLHLCVLFHNPNTLCIFLNTF